MFLIKLCIIPPCPSLLPQKALSPTHQYIKIKSLLHCLTGRFISRFQSVPMHKIDSHRPMIGMARSPPMIQTIVRQTTHTLKEIVNNLFHISNPITFLDLTDFYGFGKEKRRNGNLEILAGRDTFRCCTRFRFFLSYNIYINFKFICRDGFHAMLESVVANGHTFEDCKEILRTSLYYILVFTFLAVAAFLTLRDRHQA